MSGVPKMTLGLVAQEIRAHVEEQRRLHVKRRLVGQITLLRAAAVLVSSTNDGMSNSDRVEAVENALKVLKGEGGHE